MPSGDMYQHWLNASPTTAFPFSVVDKKLGKMQQTWADVRNGLQKDVQSSTLPFCMAHITPSVLQCNLIGDSIKRENRLIKKWTEQSEESARRAGSRQLQEAGSPAELAGSPFRPTSNLSNATSAFRSSTMTQAEREMLTNTDGGRGRVAYLKHRRSLSPTERFGRPRTMQMLYGWDFGASPVDRSNSSLPPISPTH
jgi:hypothetical protein